MNYCNIDNDDKEHLLKLIDFIYHEVIRSGGDGDAFWYSEYYDIHHLLPLIEEYNSKLKYKWEIRVDEGHQLIHWGENQEWATITNNKELYDSCPDWEQIKIRY